MRIAIPALLRRIACALVLVTALPVLTSAQQSAPDGIEPAARLLWSRGSERFQRQWLLAGPTSSAAIAALDMTSMQPAAGQPVAPDGPVWIPQVSWGDVTDLGTVFPVTSATGADRYTLAFATIRRPQAGPAELSLGVEGAFEVWVNGESAHEGTQDVFSFDRRRVPVRLRAGDNRVALKLRLNESGATRFALRVVEPGTILRPVEEIVPHLLSGENTLALRTHLEIDAQGAPVEVSVIAAGGRIVSRTSAPRGEVVRFESAGWPDGAYELRAVTNDDRGRRYVTHVPWYKGDAIAAARRLLDDASAADGEDPNTLTLRMLAEMVRARAGAQMELVRGDTWRKLHPALMEHEELRLDASGGALVRAGGFVRLAYRDEVDGSAQFCRAYLPLHYAATQRWPMIVSLHGYNPGNPRYHAWWSADLRHSQTADQDDAILVEPHGRGNAQYIGIGENDVLRCIDAAKRRFAVDEDRVYLTGGSMGGHGTWRIASRHPHLFAAAAPVFGGWDLRVGLPGGPAGAIPEPKNSHQFFGYERASSFSAAEALVNVPLLVLHGDTDAVVTVEGSRHAVRMLQRWGYDVRYHEMPGWGHEDLLDRERIVDWLLTHRRDPAPRRVRLRSVDLAGARAHWISVTAIEHPVRLVRVDAEVVRPGMIRLDTENAAELTLAPPPELRGTSDALKIVWNGVAQDATLKAGAVQLRSPAATNSALRKSAGLEGPVADIVSTPFAIVVGTTSKDPLMRKYCEDKATAMRTLWEKWQHASPRVIRDTELSRLDERRLSLILIGGQDANAVTRRLAARLPAKIASDSVTIDGRKWPTSDAVLEMIYPNPSAPDRYVLVVAATSPAGMYLWKPVLLHPSIGFPLSQWDWRLYDGRTPPPNDAAVADDLAVAAGAFDASWRRDDRWTIEGNRERRGTWKLRRPPAPGYSVAATALQAYAGSYELFPGFVITVSVEDGALTVRVPGEPPWRPLPESERMFTHPVTGNSMEFIVDGGGQVSGIAAEGFDSVAMVRRVR
jgi:poly(3-hydroxybutyrate) depolymerase